MTLETKHLFRLLAAAVVVLVMTTPVCAETLNRIVAIVNDDAITSYQLDERLTGTPDEQRSEMAPVLLERMVEELLLEQRAKELGIGVSEEEIDSAVSDVQVQNRLTLEQLEQALAAQGQTLASYRSNLRSEILRYKLLGREVRAKADVTTQELRNYFEENSDNYRLPPSVQLGVLNVSVPEDASEEGERLLRAKAQAVREQLGENDDFEALVAEVGADPDIVGSDLGTFAEPELSTLFAEAIRGLPQGGVSEILEIPTGLAVLKVLERTPGGVRDFEEVRREIEEIVRERKTQELFEAWKKGLRDEAHIDIRL